ncbi:DUF2059 domain-containing protein [Pseudoxanthomonas sp. F11]|uniref:DUF2059 domain-containing protein n=1 Tax=Pseudoxanthomonas sp. F11 TaxID=3126308 RepID=UPI00300D58C5
MKKWMLRLLLAVIAPVPVYAAPASEASVHELLEVTRARQMLEQVYGQMESMYAGSMQQALGDDVTPEAQARMQRFSARMTALMKQEMGWDVMAPMYVDIYSKSFSEDEIQGMLAFYRTPAGQAVIEKMPLVMQNTMQAVQERMGAMMPAMQKMIAEEMERTPAASE